MPNTFVLPSVVVLLLVVGTRSDAQDKRRCEKTPVDSTNPAAPVYRDCHVEKKARTRGTPPRSTFTPPPNGPNCYRAAYEFVVDTTGRPEMNTVKRVSTTDDAFGVATEATIVGLLYEPARLAGAPVRQLVEYEMRASVSRVVTTGGGRPGSGSMPRRPLC